MEENKIEQRKSIRRKAIFILPNLFTSAALFLGFLSILFAIKDEFTRAAFCIFIAAFLDGIDGKVARLTGTSSDFGIQYDSLSDLISFGMAPSILMWSWQLEGFDRLGVGVSFLIALCAALRLARFNVAANITPDQKKFFVGLPSPAAGCTIASFVLFQPYIPDFFEPALPYFTLILSAVIALLMVSRVRYYAFKDLDYAKKYPLRMLVLVVCVFIILYSNPRLFIFPVGLTYLLFGILYTFVYIPHRNKKILSMQKL